MLAVGIVTIKSFLAAPARDPSRQMGCEGHPQSNCYFVTED